MLGRLADIARRDHDYSSALEYASLVLKYDAGREDAHRTLMYCYAVLGQRVQAMRQYLLCERLLRGTFDAVPEPATQELYDRLRLHPGGVLEESDSSSTPTGGLQAFFSSSAAGYAIPMNRQPQLL
jgi:DNA-binding SARP family transcriptional activator